MEEEREVINCYLTVLKPWFLSEFILFLSYFISRSHRYLLSVNSWAEKLKSWEKGPKDKEKNKLWRSSEGTTYVHCSTAQAEPEAVLFQNGHAEILRKTPFNITYPRTVMLLIARPVLLHVQSSKSMSIPLKNGHAAFDVALADLHVVILIAFSINRKWEVF